jgi:hypothetical protein
MLQLGSFCLFLIKSLCCSTNQVICKPLFSSQSVIEFGRVTRLPSSIYESPSTFFLSTVFLLLAPSKSPFSSNFSLKYFLDASLVRTVEEDHGNLSSYAFEAASGDGLSRYSNFCHAQSTKTGINGSIRKTQTISWKQRIESQEKHRNSKRKPDGLLKHCHSTALSGFKLSEITTDSLDFV